MKVFTRRAMKLSQSVGPVVKLIREKVEQHSGKIEETKKVANAQFTIPALSSPSPEKYIERWKRRKGKRRQEVNIEDEKLANTNTFAKVRSSHPCLELAPSVR